MYYGIASRSSISGREYFSSSIGGREYFSSSVGRREYFSGMRQ